MRTPLEYGDNFPVPTGSWDPRVPWRFPRTHIRRFSFGSLSEALPWIMLALGVTLGVVMGTYRGEVFQPPQEGIFPKEVPRAQIPMRPADMVPRNQAIRPRSRLA